MNIATVSATTGDSNPANNTATATTSLVIDADVRVTKSGPSTVVAGQTVSYTIIVTNDGPSSATGVSLSIQRPRAWSSCRTQARARPPTRARWAHSRQAPCGP